MGDRPPERDRVELFSQGDIFGDVQLAYPMPAVELLVDQDESGGGRQFLSGPLEFGEPAMLITPSCSARSTARFWLQPSGARSFPLFRSKLSRSEG
jgi:hypothetical protein